MKNYLIQIEFQYEQDLQLSNRSNTDFLASLKKPPPLPLTNGTNSTVTKSTTNGAASHAQASASAAHINRSSSFINDDDEDENYEHNHTASSSKRPNGVQQKSKKSTTNKRHSHDDDEPYVAPTYITSKKAKTTRLIVSDTVEPASNNHRVRFSESVEVCSTETYSV
jgi:hypothetical protein